MSECLGKIKQGMERREAEKVWLFFSLFCVLPSVYVCLCVREGKGRKGDGGNDFGRVQNGLMIWGVGVDWAGFRSC